MAGIKESPFSSSSGAPLIFREGQSAARNFKISLRNAVFTDNALIPKPKFLFFVKFIQALNNSAAPGRTIADTNKYSDPAEGIVFQVKTIDKPKFNIKTETLHQYNKKRVIQTQIDYQPMTITFHDDVSNRVIKFWKDYYEYYYGDGRKESTNNWREDIVTKEFDDTHGSGWGYLGQFNGGFAGNKHFLDSIVLYQFYGKKFTSMAFVNPKISVFDHDANDYADGREGQGIRITFDYEGVVYNLGNNPINDQKAEEFNFSDEYFDIGDGYSGGAEIRTDGNKEVLDDITSGVAGPRPTRPTPVPGSNRLRKQINTASRILQNAGGSALGGSNISFGTGAYKGKGNRGVDFPTLTTLAGETPSPDSIIKSTGIQRTTDNQGVFIKPTNSDSAIRWFDTSETINTGFDSTKIDAVAGRLRGDGGVREIPLGPGESTLTTQGPKGFEDQAAVLAIGAVYAQRQGVVDKIFTEGLETIDTDEETSFFIKKKDGTILVTPRGAAVANALRNGDSVIGLSDDRLRFIDRQDQSSDLRMLEAVRTPVVPVTE